MVSGSLARRYARAVFSLGTDSKSGASLDVMGRDLRSLAAAMKTSEELTTTLTNPAMRRADRKRVLEAIMTRLGITGASRNTVLLLLDRERVSALPAISRELDAMIEEKAGRVSAEVTSAVALTPVQAQQITASLEKISGKKVELIRKEDPSLLGGVIAKLGDVVFDGSVRTQLGTLRDQLGK